MSKNTGIVKGSAASPTSAARIDTNGRLYSLTLFRSKDPLNSTESDLEEHILSMEHVALYHGVNMLITEPCLESTKKGYLHVHAVARTDKPLRYAKLKCKHWHTKFEELKTEADYQRWNAYCHKSCCEEARQTNLEARLNRTCLINL